MRVQRLVSLALGIIVSFCSISAFAQDDIQSFRNFQLSFSRVSQAYATYNDSLSKAFKKQNIAYPSKDIFLRVFKAQNEMELWARDEAHSEYKLIETLRICALSGVLGPKRAEGDRQVPEGYYFIEEFNPKSDYYLSLLINYPNYSDQILGNRDRPGGDIYIHGGCVTVGCMPMTDPVIEELYVICMNAKLNGNNYIPVHIYPTRFNKTGLDFLGRNYADATTQKFWVNLKASYDYFEANHKLMPVMYKPNGEYVD